LAGPNAAGFGAGWETEDRPDIAPAHAAMTSWAGPWATREVGAEIHTVTDAAAELGVSWHTVVDAVAYWGQALVEDPDRVGTINCDPGRGSRRQCG
jgi:hypothetical protein